MSNWTYFWQLRAQKSANDLAFLAHKSFCVYYSASLLGVSVAHKLNKHLKVGRESYHMLAEICGSTASTGVEQPTRAGYTQSLGMGLRSWLISEIFKQTEYFSYSQEYLFLEYVLAMLFPLRNSFLPHNYIVQRKTATPHCLAS